MTSILGTFATHSEDQVHLDLDDADFKLWSLVGVNCAYLFIVEYCSEGERSPEDQKYLILATDVFRALEHFGLAGPSRATISIYSHGYNMELHDRKMGLIEEIYGAGKGKSVLIKTKSGNYFVINTEEDKNPPDVTNKLFPPQ